MVSKTLRPYFNPGNDPVPITQEAGWDPGPIWTSGKSRPTGIRSPDCPARRQSLYRLSYPARYSILLFIKIKNNLHFRQQSDNNSAGLKKFYHGQWFTNYEIVCTLAINKEKFPVIEVLFLLHIEISVTGRRRTL
jgi:hypothetical protein